eukprot:gene2521-3570_t
MSDLAITGLLVLSLFLILGSGVWIGLTLSGVAWIAMQLFSARPAGDAMAVTIWGSASSWTLTALPLFIWMGEILFRTRLSQDMFKGLAPWVQALNLRVDSTDADSVTLRLPQSDELSRVGGMLCGQAMMAAADTAMVLALIRHFGEFRPCTTVQLNTSFLKPLSGQD